jgi:hypothetical protein
VAVELWVESAVGLVRSKRVSVNKSVRVIVTETVEPTVESSESVTV